MVYYIARYTVKHLYHPQQIPEPIQVSEIGIIVGYFSLNYVNFSVDEIYYNVMMDRY